MHKNVNVYCTQVIEILVIWNSCSFSSSRTHKIYSFIGRISKEILLMYDIVMKRTVAYYPHTPEAVGIQV